MAATPSLFDATQEAWVVVRFLERFGLKFAVLRRTLTQQRLVPMR